MDMFATQGAFVNDMGLRVPAKHAFSHPVEYPLANKAMATAAQIEAWLISETNDLLAHYEVDQSITTRLSNPQRVWRTQSALQKAIRRGDALTAKRCANALFFSEPNRLYHRLPIIAYEDIGLADPYVVALAGTVLKAKYRRNATDTHKLIFWLVDLMCAANKSRALCDGVVAVGFSDMWVSKAKNHPMSFVEIVTDDTMHPSLRVAVMWALVGTRTAKNTHWGVRDQSPSLGTVVKSFNLPPLIDYIFWNGLGNRMEALPIGVPIMYQLIARDNFPVTREWSYTCLPAPVIKGLPAYAYDWHCKEGKMALGKMLLNCKAVHAFFAEHPVEDQLRALGMALFECETGNLHNELTFPELQQVYDGSWASMAKGMGLTHEAFLALIETVRENIGMLNQIRQETVW